MILKVGFFSSARYPTGQTVAEVAFYNEFGTRRIPERPFFRRAREEMNPEIRRLLRKTKARDLAKNPRHIRQQFDRAGALAASIVQKHITQLDSPANAPSTVEEKGSTNPLIDTGLMRASVTWRIV